MPTDEALGVAFQLARIKALYETPDCPPAIQRLVVNGADDHFCRIIFSRYAGFLAGRASSLDLTPEQYGRIIGFPVLSIADAPELRDALMGLAMPEALAVRQCRQCGDILTTANTTNNAPVICQRCRRDNEMEKKRQQRGTDLSTRSCQVCGTAFTPKRTHAVCCSPKCRAKLSRQRNKAGRG